VSRTCKGATRRHRSFRSHGRRSIDPSPRTDGRAGFPRRKARVSQSGFQQRFRISVARRGRVRPYRMNSPELFSRRYVRRLREESLALGYLKRSGTPAVFHGPPGIGKSWTAHALLQESEHADAASCEIDLVEML